MAAAAGGGDSDCPATGRLARWRAAVALPRALCGTDGAAAGEGSGSVGFTADSILRRLPAILDETVRHLPADVRASAAAGAAALKDEIAGGVLHRDRLPRQPPAHCGWDADYLAGVEGASWLQAPWFLVENYFYRRLLAVAATDAAPDPFAHAKAAAVASAVRPFCDTVLPLCCPGATVALYVRALLYYWRFVCRAPRCLHPYISQRADVCRLRPLCLRSLWGNRADLSLSAGRVEGAPDLAAAATDKLLVDDVDHAVAALASAAGRTVVIVLDNCGLELFCDLALADALLVAGLSVILQAKVRYKWL